MVLQTTGSISLQDIATEFGGASPHSLSEYYAGGLNVPVGATGPGGPIPSSGAISLDDFYGTSATTFIFFDTLAGGTSYNLNTELISAGWDGVFPVQATLTVTGAYQSTLSTTPAFATGAIPGNSIIAITLNSGSSFRAKGGNGGNGGGISGFDGLAGGHGIVFDMTPNVSNVLSVTNNSGSEITGGGGGGAGGDRGDTGGAEPETTGGGGGGGGAPLGNGGSGGFGISGAGSAGTSATATAAGLGGSGGGGNAESGANGGARGIIGAAGSNRGLAGPAGNSIRKEGNTVTVSGTGTLFGSIVA